MPNGTYGGVRGRKTKAERKLLCFPPTRLYTFISFEITIIFTETIQSCYMKQSQSLVSAIEIAFYVLSLA